MNEEALQEAFRLFVETGYDGDINRFKNLISTNEEALREAHKLFIDTGYDGDIEKFKVLVGVPASTTADKKKELPFGIQSDYTEAKKQEPMVLRPEEPTESLSEGGSLERSLLERVNETFFPEQERQKKLDQLRQYETQPIEDMSVDGMAPPAQVQREDVLSAPKSQIEQKVQYEEKMQKIEEETPDFLKPSLNAVKISQQEKSMPNFVADLNYNFNDAGFNFEKYGSYIVMTAPDGTKESIQYAYGDKDGAVDQIKYFIKTNSAKLKDLDRIETLYRDENKKFNTDAQVDFALKQITEEQNEFIKSARDFMSRRQQAEQALNEINNMPAELRGADYRNLKFQAEQNLSNLYLEGVELQNKINKFPEKQRNLEIAIGKYTTSREKQGTWVGGMYNKALDGLGKTLAGLTDVAIDLKTAIPLSYQLSEKELNERRLNKLIERGIDKETAIKALSGDENISIDPRLMSEVNAEIRDEIRKDQKYGAEDEITFMEGVRGAFRQAWGDKSTTQQWEDLTNKNFFGQAILGMAESIPSMLMPGGAIARRVAMYGLVNDGINQEFETNPNLQGISESEKLFIKIPIGIVGAVLEEKGLSDVIKGTGILNTVTGKILSKAATGMTPKAFKELAETEIGSMIKNGTLRVVGGALSEMETGASQQAVDIGVKSIYNTVKDKKMFDTPDTVFDIAADIIKSGVQEAIGGAVITTPFAVAEAFSKNDIAGIPKQYFDIFVDSANDINKEKAFIASLKNNIAQGKMTNKQAVEILNNYRHSVGMLRSIPEEVSTVGKQRAMQLMKERQDLERKIEGKDDALAAPIKEKIKVINNKLSKITEDAIQEQTTGEVPVQSEAIIGEEMAEGKSGSESEGPSQETIISPGKENESRAGLVEYFSNNTRPTEDWKYNPDISGDGELAYREQEQALIEAGADRIQAHGMNKGSVGSQFNDLMNILTNGIDERGGGMLYTAPLAINPEDKTGMGAALGTGGGTAYTDGGFIILARPGVNTIRSIDDIGGVLVNEAVAESMPELVQRLRDSFPNLSIDSYSNSVSVVNDMNSRESSSKENSNKPKTTTEVLSSVETDATFMDETGNEVPVKGNEEKVSKMYDEAVNTPVEQRTQEQNDIIDNVGTILFENQIAAEENALAESVTEEEVAVEEFTEQDSTRRAELQDALNKAGKNKRRGIFVNGQTMSRSEITSEIDALNQKEEGARLAKEETQLETMMTAKANAIKSKVRKAVENASKAIAKILPNTKIVIHETNDDYVNATGDEEMSSGLYVPGEKGGTIHINLSNANTRTVGHEVFHAIILRGIKSDAQAQRLAKSMINAVIKSLQQDKAANSELIGKLEDFVSNYEENIQNEEYLAEVFGYLADGYPSLDKPARSAIKRFIDTIAKLFGFRQMTDSDVIDMMNTLSRKVATGEEITEKDVIKNREKIGEMNKRFQANFLDKESGLEFVFFKNEEEFKQLEEKYITRDKKISDFNGKYMMVHIPDTAFSGMIYKNGELLVEGKGGVFYPLKFHKDGYFWASTSSAAINMAKSLNEMLKKNNGKIYMALASSKTDKLFSSTTMANAVLDFFKSKAFDSNFDINEDQLKSSLIIAANHKGEKDAGLKMKLNKNMPLDEIIVEIQKKLGAERSAFPDRKDFCFMLMSEMAKHINKSEATRNKFGKLFSEGIQNKYFKGIKENKSKGKVIGTTTKISKANIAQALGEMFTEPMLKEGVDKEKGGQVYAVIEITGKVEPVEAVKLDKNGNEVLDKHGNKVHQHESYPMAIKSSEGNKVTVHILKERPFWNDVFEDPYAGGVISFDAGASLLPATAGITHKAIKVNTNLSKKEIKAQREKDALMLKAEADAKKKGLAGYKSEAKFKAENPELFEEYSKEGMPLYEYKKIKEERSRSKKEWNKKKENISSRKQKSTTNKDAEKIVETGRVSGFSDKAIENVLRKKGFTDEVIAKVMGTEAKGKVELNEETLPGYNKLMERVKGVVERSMRRGATQEKAIENAIANVESKSPEYASATDQQREAIIREIRAMFGLKEKKAPSKEKITGKPKPTKVTVNEMTALKDQLRLEAKAAREAKGDLNAKRKILSSAVTALVKAGKISTAQAASIINRIGKVNLDNPIMVDRLLDYAENIFNDADYDTRMNEVRRLQSQVKRKKHTSMKSVVNQFASINPELIPDNKIMEYIQALDDMNTRTPFYGKMNGIFDEILSYNTESKYDSVKTYEQLVEKIKEISLNKVKSVEDYVGLIRDINSAKRKAYQLMSNGDMSMDDYTQLIEDIGADQKAIEERYKDEIAEIKDGLISEINKLKPSENSEFSNEENALIKKYLELKDSDLEGLSPEDLFVLNDLLQNIKDGEIDYYRFNDILSRAYTNLSGTRLGEQLNKSKVDMKSDRGIQRMSEFESSFWEGILGLGRVTSGALQKFVVSPFMRAISSYENYLKNGYSVFSNLKKKYKIKAEQMHKIGILTTYLQEYMAQFDPSNSNIKGIGTRDWFREILESKDMMDDYKSPNPSIMRLIGVGKSEIDTIKKIWDKLPKDSNGNVDPKAVYESYMANDGKYFSKNEHGFFSEVSEWKQNNLTSKQKAANEMRGNPFKEIPFHMMRVRLNRDAKQIKPKDTSGTTSGLVSIEAGTGKERAGEKIGPIMTNFEELFIMNLEQTARDYYIGSAIKDINNTLSSAKKTMDDDKQVLVKTIAGAMSEALKFEFDKSGVQYLLKNLLSARATMALFDPERTVRELISSLVSFPIRAKTVLGYKDLFGSQGAMKELLEFTESPIRLRENINKAIDINDGQVKEKSIISKSVEYLAGLPERTMMVTSWMPTFNNEFKQITGQAFDIKKFKSSEKYRQEFGKAIKEAAAVADAQTEKIIGTTTKAGQRREIRIAPRILANLLGYEGTVKKNSATGQIVGFFTNYPYREISEFINGFKEAAEVLRNGEGGLKALAQLQKPLGVSLNVAMYGFLANVSYALTLMLLGDSEDEEKGDAMLKEALTPSGFMEELGGNMLSLAASKYAAGGKAILQLSASGAAYATDDEDTRATIKKMLRGSVFLNLLPFEKTGSYGGKDAWYSAIGSYIPNLVLAVDDVTSSGQILSEVKHIYKKVSDSGIESLTEDEGNQVLLLNSIMLSTQIGMNAAGTSLPMYNKLKVAMRGLKESAGSEEVGKSISKKKKALSGYANEEDFKKNDPEGYIKASSEGGELYKYKQEQRKKREGKGPTPKQDAMKGYKTEKEFKEKDPYGYRKATEKGGSLYEYKIEQKKFKGLGKEFRGMTEEKYKKEYPKEWKEKYGPGTKYYKEKYSPEGRRKRAEEQRKKREELRRKIRENRK